MNSPSAMEVDQQVPSATQLRVRYADTDAAGIVYYARYLAFFEAGRAEALRQLGSLDAEVAACALAAPVLEATIRYRAPAAFDEVLVIQTKVADIDSGRFRFAYEIRRATDHVLIATGETLHAWTGADSSHTDDLPDWFRTALEQLRAAD
jgi:acyl-CoA thioester hydrolase